MNIIIRSLGNLLHLHGISWASRILNTHQNDYSQIPNLLEKNRCNFQQFPLSADSALLPRNGKLRLYKHDREPLLSEDSTRKRAETFTVRI